MQRHQTSSALLLALILVGCGNNSTSNGKTEPVATAVPHEGAAEESTEPPAAQAGSDAGPAEQSFAAGVAHMCNAPSEMTPALADLTPDRKATELARWIDEGLTNEEARALFASLADKTPAQKQASLDEAAQRAGLDSCELSGIYEQP